MTCLAKSSFCDSRVTPVGGPMFLHINSLACLAGSTHLRQDNQSMHVCCWLGQRGQLFPHINACWSMAGRVTLLPWTGVLLNNQGLSCLSRPSLSSTFYLLFYFHFCVTGYILMRIYQTDEFFSCGEMNPQ